MINRAAAELYEHPAFLSITGGVLRPGGMDLTRRMVAECCLPVGSRIVDVGCGRGATVDCLRREFGLMACGLDIERRFDCSPEAARPLAQADAMRLPVRSRTVSAVVCECVLSLLPDPDEALAEFRRVLVDRGLVLITDMYVRAPDAIDDLSVMPTATCLRGALPRGAIEQRLRRHGFEVLGWEDQTAALKRLSAEIVFACGSLQAFWGAVGASGPGTGDTSCLLRARPGYFACVARKENHP